MNTENLTDNTYLKDKYRQLFRNLTFPERVKNFHPVEFIKLAKKIGAEVVFVDVRTQCYSLHNTKVYEKDPVLKERDLVRECVDLCRKNGLKFVGYVAPLSFEAWWRKKLQWQQRKANGEKVACGFWNSWGCWNTEFGEFICSELREIAENYRPDGFYIDGLIIEANGCYCDVCRRKFKKETGYKIPEKPKWNSKIWYEYIRWRYRQVENFAKMISEAIHSVDPKIEIIFNCPHAWCGWYSGQSYLPAKYLNRVGTETYINVASIVPSQKFWSLITHTVYRVYVTRMLQNGKRSHSYTYLPPDVPEAEVITEINTILASGGIPCVQGCASYLKKIMDEIKKTEPYLVNSKQVRLIGLVYSDMSRDCYYKEDDKRFFAQIHGLFNFLVENHFLFELVGDHQIEKDEINDFKLLILPNVTTLTKKGWNNLKKYVEKGGILITTYKTGLFDMYGKIKGRTLLWDGSELYVKKEIKTEKPYFIDNKGRPQDNIPPEFNQYLIFDDKKIKEFNLNFSALLNGGGWVEYEIPEYITRNLNIYGSALDVEFNNSWEVILPFHFKEKPKSKVKKTMGLGRKKLGKGYIYYINFDLGEILSKKISENMKNFLNTFISKIISKVPVKIKGPESVYFSLWKQKDRYIVHLVNELSPQGRPASREKMRTEILPVSVKISVNLPNIKEIKKVLGSGSVRIKENEIIIIGLKERIVLTIK